MEKGAVLPSTSGELSLCVHFFFFLLVLICYFFVHTKWNGWNEDEMTTKMNRTKGVDSLCGRRRQKGTPGRTQGSKGWETRKRGRRTRISKNWKGNKKKQKMKEVTNGTAMVKSCEEVNVFLYVDPFYLVMLHRFVGR